MLYSYNQLPSIVNFGIKNNTIFSKEPKSTSKANNLKPAADVCFLKIRLVKQLANIFYYHILPPGTLSEADRIAAAS